MEGNYFPLIHKISFIVWWIFLVLYILSRFMPQKTIDPERTGVHIKVNTMFLVIVILAGICYLMSGNFW